MLSDTERQEKRRLIKAAAEARDAQALLKLTRELVHESTKAQDTLLCATALTTAAEAQQKLGARRLRTFIARSVTVEPFLASLTVAAALAGFVLDTTVGGYGSFYEELLNPQSQLYKSSPDLVLVLLDLEDVAGRLPQLCATGNNSEVEEELAAAAARIQSMLESFRGVSSASVLLQGFAVPDTTSLGDVGDANLIHSLPYAVMELNRRLAVLCGNIAACVFFDVDRVAARYGRLRWRDERMFLASRLPVATEAFALYARSVVRSFAVLFRAARKVLCTDLDNTLWGGVLGEDGIDGIATGPTFPGNSYMQYQLYLKQLASRGVLLAVVSKNNEADVRQAFEARKADLSLNLNDFVATRIGWGEKTQAIRSLAEELSLGLDSFVFVDDNPVECEAVRQQLPQVAVIEVAERSPWKTVEMLAQEAFFDAANITSEDLNRLEDYKAQTQRAALSQSAGSHEELLASLGIVCEFSSALDAPLARAEQMLAKTNQFNLTTRRHSAAKVKEFATEAGSQAVVVRVRDRFGDAGVVGLALASTVDEVCRIDSLLLSCRVIGRGIETALLAHVAEQANKIGARRLAGEFIPTKKNAPCSTFYPDHGFIAVASPADAESGSLFYELDLATSAPITPAWITSEGSASHEPADHTLVAS